MENSPKNLNLKQDKEQRWVNWRCHHFLWVQARDFNLLWPWYNILSDLINIVIISRFPLALSKTYLLDRNALQNEIKRSKLTEVVRNTLGQARRVGVTRVTLIHSANLAPNMMVYVLRQTPHWLIHFNLDLSTSLLYFLRFGAQTRLFRFVPR